MKVPFNVGETEIHAMVHQHLIPFPTMINVHDDEDTSVKAGINSVERQGGRVIELVHSGARLIKFKLLGGEYQFDPNRMFSDPGIEATLRKEGAFTPEAQTAVKAFAHAFLEKFGIEREPVIIALHNTVDGLFSVESFAPDGEYGADISDFHITAQRSRFDFFYVTDQVFFDYLRDRDFNVVLQNNMAVKDDGSLSVHCAKLGIPYVNIEAEMTHFEEQMKMVSVVRQMIGR
jgi:hypothetical protein